MTLAGVNTHTGGNIVNEGILKVLSGGTFSGDAGQLSTNGTGIADLNGTNQTVGILDGSGGKILNSLVSTNSVLTVGGGDASGGEYFGSITVGTANPAGDFNSDGTVDAADYVVWRKTINTPTAYDTWRANFGATGSPGGDITLVKTGLGAVTVSGTNTYMGTTTVQSGALVFGTPASLYNNQQGTFAGSWNTTNIVVEPNATLGFRVGEPVTSRNRRLLPSTRSVQQPAGMRQARVGLSPSVASYTYTSAIGNAAGGANVTGLNKLGPNTLVVTGANTYGGNTQVSEGVLSVSQINNVVGGTSSIPLGCARRQQRRRGPARLRSGNYRHVALHWRRRIN